MRRLSGLIRGGVARLAVTNEVDSPLLEMEHLVVRSAGGRLHERRGGTRRPWDLARSALASAPSQRAAAAGAAGPGRTPICRSKLPVSQ